MQNNENNYAEAERRDKEKQKKIVFNSKIEFIKESFIYDFCIKCLNFGPASSPPVSTNIQFEFLIWHSISLPSVISEFSSKFLTMRST